MRKTIEFLIMVSLLSFGSVVTAQMIKITGKLVDRDEGRLLGNGVIFLNPGNQVTTSDKNGFFSFLSTPGSKQITTRAMGYKSALLKFEAGSDTVINIYLLVSPFELSEITVVGDSINNLEVTQHGNFLITPAALREIPRLFSEPDLLKSFQLLPGVTTGKDGSSDIYVRGGGAGQNIVIANGCYFFLPGHLLGVISPYDLDFLENAGLYKDYFPAELGGGASSVISMDFKKPQSDSLRTQVRLGLLSSGLTVDVPLKKINWDLTAGLKRGNYSLYAPLLKKIVSSDADNFLPPDNYSFYDGFLRLSNSSAKWGNFSYLFFGNYDFGRNENRVKSQSADTSTFWTEGISTGWNNMVHAIQWEPAVKGIFKWKFNLNYNRLSMGRRMYSQTERSLNGSGFDFESATYSFSPANNSLGLMAVLAKESERFSYSAGITGRFRFFFPNITASGIHNGTGINNSLGENSRLYEPAAFISSSVLLAEKIHVDAGLRVSGGIIMDAGFLVVEPRLRIAFNPSGNLSPHINYVRLSQFDHSLEGSNAGLRTMLWLPVSKDFGPEISDVISAGFQGKLNNDFTWTLDGYFKTTTGMTDYKPGASFIFDTTFVDMLDRINGRAYGLEVGLIKRTGKLTGSLSYTYSRSKREWGAPEGMMWIPANADRPHNLNLALKYYFKKDASFGLNWIYISGSPATIYMHDTSYGEFFETKNNIRYFDYHHLDLSFRKIIYKRRFSIYFDADLYNVYNHKNTFYFKKTYDEKEKRYYFKNISLFPIMPSLTVTIKY